MSTMWTFVNPYDHRAVTCLDNIYQLNWKARQKAAYVSLLLRHPLTYLLACFETAWSCHIVKTNSAQRITLTKSYEYLQTLVKDSYCAKAVLNRLSDDFYRLVVCTVILQIFFMSVLTNLNLFRMVYFQHFHIETVVNSRITG